MVPVGRQPCVIPLAEKQVVPFRRPRHDTPAQIGRQPALPAGSPQLAQHHQLRLAISHFSFADPLMLVVKTVAQDNHQPVLPLPEEGGDIVSVVVGRAGHVIVERVQHIDKIPVVVIAAHLLKIGIGHPAAVDKQIIVAESRDIQPSRFPRAGGEGFHKNRVFPFAGDKRHRQLLFFEQRRFKYGGSALDALSLAVGHAHRPAVARGRAQRRDQPVGKRPVGGNFTGVQNTCAAFIGYLHTVTLLEKAAAPPGKKDLPAHPKRIGQIAALQIQQLLGGHAHGFASFR